MTVPITPAELDELEQIYTEYTRPWNGTQLQEDRNFSMREALDTHTPALIAAVRERDTLRVDFCDSLAEVATLELVNETMIKRAEEAEEERDEARAELAEARAVLTHLEWQYDDRGDVCLSCHNLRSEGHAPDCALAAALGKKPTMPTGQEKSS